MGYTAYLVMCERASQLINGNFLTGNSFDNLGPCYEHVGYALNHEHKISERRRVYGAPCTRPEYHRYLRNHT